ncbi:MAG: CHAT domain-containing protein [Chitinophagaceae bacterium]|nr:MAG: CHAT domain-containing protein [Chitinophagaceae bacterium]
MRMSKAFMILCCWLFASITLFAQPDNASVNETKILQLYEKQLREGLSLRGMPASEIEKYMARGKAGLSSIDDFTQELSHLYSSEKAGKIAVLLFFFNQDSLYRFFITPGQLREKKVMACTKGQLERLNTDIYQALKIYELSESRSPIKRGNVPLPRTPKNNVSLDKAIQNATDILMPSGFDEQYKHLIIVPAFSIGAFPFQLLRPYKDNSFLVDKCSYSIAPGLLDFMAVRKKILQTFRQQDMYDIPDKVNFTLSNPLFICNPAYPKNSPYVFPDLPGAKKEIAASLPYARDYLLLEGIKATKQNLLKHIRDADLLYLATHAMSSETNPLDNNFLVLAGESDPFFTSRNIMALRDTNVHDNYRFPEMVILSACQTGLGKSMEAGITAGVARSFLIAGARQVLMSLWSVDDEATAYLMSRFIYHLKDPHEFLPSEPLRLAQLDCRKKYPNPAHWASFSVYGVDY